MAICVIKTTAQLEEHFVLTPERYNPKRRMSDETDGLKLSEIAYLSDDVLTIKKGDEKNLYQINTGDAMSGYLRIPSSKDCLNSNKKILHRGDVIISRLRPYLKQVAFVDETSDDDALYASTEFYVLRSRNDESIAFLVPYLLSDVAQSVFANSVEGSQHPRFKEEDINNLVIPNSLLKVRNELSTEVEKAINDYREYEKRLSKQIIYVNSEMQKAL